MYCSSCGSAVAAGLSYCNHCGANLRGTKADAVSFTRVARASPDSVIWAIVGVFVVGLGSIMGLMAILKEFNAHIGEVMVFSLAVFLLMLVVESVFISLLFSRKSEGKEVGESQRLKEETTKELEAAQPRVIAEPLSSVTEHTTRAFEPIYRQKKAE